MIVLYAGDSPAGGPANYLLALLKAVRAEYVHIPPSEPLSVRWMRHSYDAVILSDFSRANLAPDAEELLAAQVKSGTGLLMVGGWGSFSGPFGGWKGSQVEALLPVECASKDDRLDFPAGAMIVPSQNKIFRDKLFDRPPVICGMNAVKVKPGAKTLVAARKIVSRRGRSGYGVSLESKDHPLLVTGSDPRSRTAALMTDAAPHWCGGMVDWGTRRVRLHVKDGIWVEVGNHYVEFFSALLKWIAS